MVNHTFKKLNYFENALRYCLEEAYSNTHWQMKNLEEKLITIPKCISWRLAILQKIFLKEISYTHFSPPPRTNSSKSCVWSPEVNVSTSRLPCWCPRLPALHPKCLEDKWVICLNLHYLALRSCVKALFKESMAQEAAREIQIHFNSAHCHGKMETEG